MTSFKFPPLNSVRFRVVVGSFVLLCFVGLARSEVWREPVNANYGYSEYNYQTQGQDTALLRRSTESEEEAEPNYRRRSATDSHGRSVLFKSLVLAPLALVVFFLFILLIIPIPVISGPTGRRSLQTSYQFRSTIQMARDVLVSEECVEKVSCELSRISKKYDMAWIPAAFEKVLTKNGWGERIVRGLQEMSGSDTNCSKLKCNAAKNLRRSFKFK